MNVQTDIDTPTAFRMLLAELRVTKHLDEMLWIETQIGLLLARLGFDPDTLPVQAFLYDPEGAPARAKVKEDLGLRDSDFEMR
ncbi:MAG: hypothetical protein GYA24_16285 [Candidatus Lokiarchaeota archaeon]|nr:hypothetical protein [Candidatus Lokiarchaeota archaeon]